MTAGSESEMVKSYIVTRPLGLILGHGHYGPGEVVIEPWLDGVAGRLIMDGYIALGQDIAVGDVPAPKIDPFAEVAPEPTEADPNPENPDDGQAPIDPDDIDTVLAGSIPDVMAWIDDHDDVDIAAVIAAEEAGKDRKGLLEQLTPRLPTV